MFDCLRLADEAIGSLPYGNEGAKEWIRKAADEIERRIAFGAADREPV